MFVNIIFEGVLILHQYSFFFFIAHIQKDNHRKQWIIDRTLDFLSGLDIHTAEAGLMIETTKRAVEYVTADDDRGVRRRLRAYTNFLLNALQDKNN